MGKIVKVYGKILYQQRANWVTYPNGKKERIVGSSMRGLEYAPGEFGHNGHVPLSINCLTTIDGIPIEWVDKDGNPSTEDKVPWV